jgi:hypothetical protein
MIARSLEGMTPYFGVPERHPEILKIVGLIVHRCFNLIGPGISMLYAAYFREIAKLLFFEELSDYPQLPGILRQYTHKIPNSELPWEFSVFGRCRTDSVGLMSPSPLIGKGITRKPRECGEPQ